MAEWITKKPAKMVDKKTTAKWITKKPKKMEDKETTAKWITKKPTKWITKKPKESQPKMKEPLSPSKRRALRIQKEDIASGETAAAKAFMTRNLPYTGDIHGKKLNKGGRAGFQHGGAATHGFNTKILRTD